MTNVGFNRLWRALAVVALLVAPTLAAASGVLRIATASGPPTLDPHFSNSRATADTSFNLFEGLVGYAEDFSVHPQLAESWTISDDGLTYTFQLYPGILFHNGRTVTANDVKVSLERVLEISPARTSISDIVSVEAVDELTVRIQLAQPAGPLLQHLATSNAVILPAEAIEGRPGGEADIIGTGPFRFVEWLPDRHVRMARFEDYVQRPGPPSGHVGARTAYVDEVFFVPVPEDSARANGLETGEYHVADFLPYGAGRRLLQNPDTVITELEQQMMVFAYLNNAEPRLTANPVLRRAIQAALNHDDMLAVAAEGYGALNPSYYFGGWYTDRGTENYNLKDPELARQLLTDAGYAGQEIVIVTNTSFDVMYRSALMIERQLQSVGVNTRLEVYDWPGSIAVRKQGEWDVFMSGHLLQIDPSVIEFHLRPASSPFKHDDDVVTDLFARARASSSPSERAELYAQLQEHTYETVPWIKLFDQNVFQGVRAEVDGYRPWPYMRASDVRVD
ncbi:MAG: ABC transporter substrate-binding protein [bacterium]|nr:ABC transporter substrate-binding protein [bacterium]